MKMILGLIPITSGGVDVFGQNIKGVEKRVYSRIGAIIEVPGFYSNLTGRENLAFVLAQCNPLFHVFVLSANFSVII